MHSSTSPMQQCKFGDINRSWRCTEEFLWLPFWGSLTCSTCLMDPLQWYWHRFTTEREGMCERSLERVVLELAPILLSINTALMRRKVIECYPTLVDSIQPLWIAFNLKWVSFIFHINPLLSQCTLNGPAVSSCLGHSRSRNLIGTAF